MWKFAQIWPFFHDKNFQYYWYLELKINVSGWIYGFKNFQCQIDALILQYRVYFSIWIILERKQSWSPEIKPMTKMSKIYWNIWKNTTQSPPDGFCGPIHKLCIIFVTIYAFYKKFKSIWALWKHIKTKFVQLVKKSEISWNNYLCVKKKNTF